MDVTTIAPSPTASTSFPMTAVMATLHAELIEAAKIEASIRGMVLPSTPAQISKAMVHLDSLVVVSILCAIEPIVGFEVPETVVSAGGYDSVESALGLLLPRLEKEWAKKNGLKS